MPVQDLTPQLRTRLSRVERAVGWFVILATILLLAGFGYYVYHTAERKGWFLTKLRYFTYVESASGLHVGDPIMLMGFPVGQITEIEAEKPFSFPYNVYVQFIVREPYYGYIWTDSYVKVIASGFLGSRALELVQGGTSTNKELHASYNVDDKSRKVLGVWESKSSNYVAYTPTSKGYGFDRARETPPVTDRLEALANQAEQALPGILDLTNKVTQVLTNVVQLTSHADGLILQAHPIITNLAVISTFLTNGQGSLGDWVLPTNVNTQLQHTLGSANATLIAANTNLGMLASNVNLTLENVANITSNLNAQVQANNQILSQISSTVVSANTFVEGLKRHWLLRSAFKNAKPGPSPETGRTNQPPETPRETPFPAPDAGTKTGKRLP
jgi:hypothetical protein